MIRRDWGRFTARGGDLIEKELTAIVSQAAETVIQTVPADRYRALVLIGGYGRGEGGDQVSPLGRAVIGGLIASTFSVLVLLPMVFAWIQNKASIQSPSLDPEDENSTLYINSNN